MRSKLPFSLIVAATLSLPTAQLAAQLQASEKFTLTQTIDSVEIKMTGSRPSMRGRQIFGDVRPWDISWTPGARNSTTLEVGRDFVINGKEVPAGRYSVWMVPRQGQPWLMMLDPRDSLFHTAHPDSTADQYHFAVNVQGIDPVETLTWSINNIRGYRSMVRMEWADKRVEFNLKLKSNLNFAIEPGIAAALVGTYSLKPQPADTTADGEQRGLDESVALRVEDDMMRVSFLGGDAEEFFAKQFYALIQVEENLFTWAEVYEGEPVQVMNRMFWEFFREGDQVTGFEVRFSPGDDLWMEGSRTPDQ